MRLFHCHEQNPIYVHATPYNDRSGGIRALYQLCHHLNRTGFHSFIATAEPNAPNRLDAPPLTERLRLEHLESGYEPIAVYGESISFNPLHAPHVVRYLLNGADFFVRQAPATYGAEDSLLHFDAAHVPAGRNSVDLYMPVVDRSIYFPDETCRQRRGFVVLTNRVDWKKHELPDWVRPVVAVTMHRPLGHQELAELYRRSRALIVFERTVAIFESLCCGCPVMCIAGRHFTPANYQPRFGGAGLIWGWKEEQLIWAANRTAEFLDRYRLLEYQAPEKVQSAFEGIVAKARSLKKAA
jgi:hypothetical protein